MFSMQYLFALGREPNISIAEIIEVFKTMKFPVDVAVINHRFLIAQTKDSLDAVALMRRLGGTIKIAKAEEAVSADAQGIATYLNDAQDGKIIFSISGENAKYFGLEIKKILKSMDRSARFVEANNTATILHNKLVERRGDITLVKKMVFITRTIQPIQEWSARDYERPAHDSKSGMLPPKLARIMINLSAADPAKDVLWDPFCGSGTMLMEAAAMGFRSLIGSDISNKAIEDTKKNIEWIKGKSHISNCTVHMFQSDVRHAQHPLGRQHVDCIVTEPYLGKPLKGRESRELLKKQTQELKIVYIEAFRTFKKILPKHSTVVCIIPRFRFEKEWISVDCVEEIERMGFDVIPFQVGMVKTHCNASLRYHRPTQHLAREIWKFRKNNS